MSTEQANSQSSTVRRASKVRHTKEDSLSELEFEQLYNASYELDPLHDLEARFILLVGGRLGLRRGEIAHIQAGWIDWRKRRIDIPRYLDCDQGRDNRACGACRMHAQQMADYNEGVTFEDALASMWQPKTEMACRSVPFDFSARAEIVLQNFFDEFDQWMYSAQAINRRVDDLADIAVLDRNVYPHALRATAASFLAGRGMSTLGLQAMMGWSQASTARAYVATNADQTARELHQING